MMGTYASFPESIEMVSGRVNWLRIASRRGTASPMVATVEQMKLICVVHEGNVDGLGQESALSSSSFCILLCNTILEMMLGRSD
jgi:hypothetical protein